MNGCNFEVKCLACSAEVGQVLNGAFTPEPAAAPILRRGGLPRCGRCGGSLYLEPSWIGSARLRPPGAMNSSRRESDRERRAI